MTNPTSDDRLLQWFRALVRSVFPRMQYTGVFDYVITGVNGEAPSFTLDVAPADASIGLPTLNAVEILSSVSSMTATPSTGMACLLVFLDANPSKPRVAGIEAAGANPVARLGDQCMSFFPPTTPIVGVITIAGVPNPFQGTVIIPNPITGTITQGSGRARTQ
jgi:hypothetical protein